ncbi:MAG: hypothetical protein EWV41_00380 [Microcystis wesenbergii Mw_MB_S_20031200_S109]|uniref:Uncharacterized protein n=1 Tax=Microcystis wesenbergii Mw_MB_S_20031200_S109D TaxID=2486241 RepID=A0A552M8W2_9CHRO|nr:MAG: hypothetical protein EWV41_00380 [Microcystis wesenbergii Mw_MB_S_20031200_S109]TRV28893.1 MAG: hypothetical protein EWV88_02300 [Microcystis wesenbergii Mw_MB_S_20031200_S109D]
MRNINLNILKCLELINNFCLSLSNIGLGVRSQYSGDSIQEIIFIYPSHPPTSPLPHTPHPTPHTLHPTPYTLHPTPHTPLPQFPTSPIYNL